eukprot:TRINITY_DN5042_c0_g5_i1.p1 TRINITY_DN5042_c0_g5~~TRINITY_DN5042_c0_g5_i1.p1  ORF type:complete len:439 (+),score=83.27 TRINITY_DN5042_c0_g5_i1:50-1318(+)
MASPPTFRHVTADELVIRICTWNVAEIDADKASSAELYQWVFRREEERAGCIPEADLMVVGLQEIDMSAKALVKGRTKKGRKWAERLCGLVDSEGDSRYRLVGHKQMMGLGLYVWARVEVEQCLQNVELVSTATGFFNAFGNKGAVCARFGYAQKSFCFVNSHLAAHQHKLERRNQDHDRILNTTAFTHVPQRLLAHDVVFWFGDLNYRLNLPREVVANALLSPTESPDAKRKLLSRHDQLYGEMRNGRAFQCFTEPEITWCPTYKLMKGSEGVYSAKRNPAYCDRILYATDAQHLPDHFFDDDDGDDELDGVLNLFECVVCRRVNKGGVLRKSGWKCETCVGKKSDPSRGSPPPARTSRSNDWCEQDSSASADESHSTSPASGYARRRTRVRCLAYTADPTATLSDHRPVHGVFAVADVFR